MGSTRFPGKALYEVKGKALLQYVIERVRRSRYGGHPVIATSCEPSDDAIFDFCRRFGLEVFRGPLWDVAGRFEEVIRRYGFDAFVRVCGDSPLIDQALIDRGCDIFDSGDFDIVTNTLHRTYPRGQSVEIVRSDVFRRTCSEIKTAEDSEHVTRFFYRNPHRFKIYNFQSPEDYGFMQLSVDTPEDMELFRLLVLQMDRPHWEYDVEALVRLYRSAKRKADVAIL